MRRIGVEAAREVSPHRVGEEGLNRRQRPPSRRSGALWRAAKAEVNEERRSTKLEGRGMIGRGMKTGRHSGIINRKRAQRAQRIYTALFPFQRSLCSLRLRLPYSSAEHSPAYSGSWPGRAGTRLRGDEAATARCRRRSLAPPKKQPDPLPWFCRLAGHSSVASIVYSP